MDGELEKLKMAAPKYLSNTAKSMERSAINPARTQSIDPAGSKSSVNHHLKTPVPHYEQFATIASGES